MNNNNNNNNNNNDQYGTSLQEAPRKPVQRGTAIRLAEFKKLAAGKNFKNLKK